MTVEKTDAPALSLGARLVKAQGIAQAVGKDAFNKYQGYHYASSESVIEEARGALAEAGLAVYCIGWAFVPSEPHPLIATNNKGQDIDLMKGAVGQVRVNYAMTDGANSWPFQTETAVIVDSGRPLDKAQATALTYNLAYFLRSLLLLPREDESESVDARDDRHQDRPATRQQAPREPEEPLVTAGEIAAIQIEIKGLAAELGLSGAPMHKHLSELASGRPYVNNYSLLCVVRDKLRGELPKP